MLKTKAVTPDEVQKLPELTEEIVEAVNKRLRAPWSKSEIENGRLVDITSVPNGLVELLRDFYYEAGWSLSYQGANPKGEAFFVFKKRTLTP